MLSGVRDEPSPTTAAASPAPAVQVYTLGGFRVVVDGQVLEDHAWRRRTARQLFKVLLSRPGRRMTRDEVVELFWPDSDADAASSNLRSTVYAMRHALERPSQVSIKELVSSDHGSVWLRPDDELWADADAFEQTVAKAWRTSNPLPLLEQASALYLGDYLPDDLYEDWAVDRRDALKRSWTELQFGLAQALEAHADVNAAMQPLERLLRADPCDERAAQELMKLLARHGRRAEALRVYQRLSQSLREELDVEPSLDSAELQRQIAAGAAPASPPIPAAAFRCSYPFPAPTELIGREAELTALSQVLAAGRTAGRVALVAAPAGTGKSALLGQIVRQAQAQGVMCLAGGCYEERGSVPLGPFHDALVDFLLAQSPERSRAEFGATIDDLAQLIPELRYHLGLTPVAAANPGSLDRMRAFAAIHACLRSLTDRGPVLVCLEDLHAADEATLQLLHYLARQTRRLPLVFVATFRSDEAPPEQPLAQTVAAMARERLALRVVLDPLDRPATNQLLSALLDGSPSEDLSESLYAATGGNPLFVEQLVLALSEAGQIHRADGVWRGQLSVQGVPLLVREVIAQRLQRLDSSCREVLAIASVIGQSIEHEVLLTVVHPLDEPVLLRHLDRAITAQVLQDTAGGYAFRHALVREAVYQSISKPQRMLLHTRVGEALERLSGSRTHDRAAELARHFVLAGHSSGLREKALRHSLLAGHAAAAVSANREALAHFETAVEIADALSSDESQQIEALEGQGHAQRELGLWAPAIDTMRRVLSLSGDPVRRAGARAELASALNHLGNSTAALDEAEAGLNQMGAAEGQQAQTVRSRLFAVKAYVRFFEGRYTSLLGIAEQMGEVAADRAEPRLLASAHTVRGWAYMGQGHVSLALEEYTQSHDLAVHSNDKIEVAMAKVNLGVQHYLGGRLLEAREQLEQGSQMFRQSAGELRIINAIQHLGRVSLAEGNVDGARAHAERALGLATVQHDYWAADCHDLLGTVSSLRGDYETALANFESALHIRRACGFRAGIVDALLGIGRVFQLQGDWTSALRYFESAVSTADAMDRCPHWVAASRCLGRLLIQKGELAGAAQAINGALSLAQTMAETLEFAPTLLAAADLSACRGDTTLARARAEAAVASSRRAEDIADSSVLLANLLLQVGALNQAEAAILEAEQLANRMLAPRLLGQAHRAAARLAFARGDLSTAAESFARCRHQYVAARMRPECDSLAAELASLGIESAD